MRTSSLPLPVASLNRLFHRHGVARRFGMYSQFCVWRNDREPPQRKFCMNLSVPAVPVSAPRLYTPSPLSYQMGTTRSL